MSHKIIKTSSIAIFILIAMLISGCAVNETSDAYSTGYVSEKYIMDDTMQRFIVIVMEDGTQNVMDIAPETYELIQIGDPITIWEDNQISVG